MKRLLSFVMLTILLTLHTSAQNGILVFQTDFGVKDGAVSAMKGVSLKVSPTLKLHDLTHEIPAYNIWEASYRLFQTARYWPVGTVFISVVDPGVGTDRKGVVAKTKNGYYFVTPDNGTLTLIAESMGIEAVREIDEKVNRLPGSEGSYTFHGRDVFAYTAARLASGKIRFDQVGPLLKPEVVRLNYQQPLLENGTLKGNIPILDVQYGNVWTNIPDTLIKKSGIKYGDKLLVKIFEKDQQRFNGTLVYAETFNAVAEGASMAYLNSLMNVSVAVNMGNFAAAHNISSGADWRIEITKSN